MLDLHLLSAQRPTGEAQPEAPTGLRKLALGHSPLFQHLNHASAECLALAGGQTTAWRAWCLSRHDGS